YMALGAVAGAGGGPITSMAGAFALPQGLRAYYSYKLDKGDIETPEQFIEVLKKSVAATAKGLVTGAATGVAGKIAAPLGGLGRTGVEAATLTGVGAGLEGRLPTSQDFFDSAMLLVGLKGVMRAPAVAARIKDLWVKSGRAPKDIVEDIKTDPKIVSVLTGEGEIPPEVIAKAKAKVEETEKNQAELAVRLAAAKKKVKPEEIVKEELKIKGEKVREAKKGKPIQPQEDTAKLKELGYDDTDIGGMSTGQRALIVNQGIKRTKPTVKAEAKKVKGKVKEEPEPKAVPRKKAKVAEPITEVDEQTGTPRPEGLAPNVHPFRDKDPKHTATMKKLYQEKINNVSATPEVFTRYLINEVNRYLNGEDVPIDKVRAGLSELSARADNLTTKFGTANDFAAWKDTVNEAAKWARESDRLIPKRTGGTRLNMMIPVDQIPDAIKGILKGIKVIVGGKDIFRNREIFDATGFWLGKDYKWRYEIGDEGLKVSPNILRMTGPILEKLTNEHPLSSVIEHPTLYDAVPELKDTTIKVNRALKTDGIYHPDTRTIEIKRPEKDIIVHETQHAVNEIMKSKFRGTSPEAEENKLIGPALEEMKKVAKNPRILSMLNDITENFIQTGNTLITKEAVRKVISASKDIDPEGSKALREAAERFTRETAFESYMKDPGEMEARLSEKRREMTAEKRKRIPPWETLDRLLVHEGIDEPIYNTYDVSGLPYSTKLGTTLYMGIDPTQIPEAAKKLFPVLSKIRSKLFDKEIPKINLAKLSPDEKAIYEEGKKWNDTFEEARKAKDFDLGRFIDRAKIHTYRAVHERKGMLRNELRKKYGEAGDKLVQFIDAADAMDGRADRMYYEMFKEAYANIPSKLTAEVDAVDLMNRLKDIYAYKTGKEFKPPKNMSPTQTAAFDGLLELYRGLTLEERARAEKSSRIMSDHVKMWVDDMVRVGLKSAEEGEKLKSHDYRKIRSFAVENMYDQKYKLRLGDKLIKQTDSGVDPLGKNAISMMETDSRILYKETANRIYRRVSNQEVKLALKEFDAKFLDNPYVIFKENDVAVGRPIRKAPKDWVTDFWYDEGKLKTYKMHPDVALQLLSSGPHMSFPLTRILTNVLGVNLTRALTVGTSALWATTRGITMDMGHSFFSARYFNEKGEPVRLFSKFAPKFVGQIGKDMGNTFYDVITRGPKTGVYEKNGGTMPFLAMREQHFLGRGTKAPGVYDKFMDGLSFWGQSM
ncbi:MAG: hypothetical protein KKB38_20915, partial [Gammaproteobacteria bacterium]|nr:hypothetical protein [Gammaproteobacteria bacterium]